MQQLERVHLVQFFLFEAQTLELDATTAIIAPNGAGKSALLDALQIVLLGGDRSRIRFNAQAGGSHRARTIRDYCLGVFRSGDDGRKRRTATTYISLVFRDTDTGEVLTAGIALGAPPMVFALIMAAASSLMMTLTHYATGTSPIIFNSGYTTLGQWWLAGLVMSAVNLVVWIVIGGVWWSVLGYW